MNYRPSSIYSQKIAREESLRSVSGNETEFRLNSEIAKLSDELQKVKEENTRLTDEVFNAQALAALSETEIKHDAEKRIKSLESALAFKEQEAKVLLQQHAILIDAEKKRKYSEMSGGFESKREPEYFEKTFKSIGINTSIETTQSSVPDPTKQRERSFEQYFIQPLLRDLHAMLLLRLTLPEGDHPTSPSSAMKTRDSKLSDELSFIKTLCLRLEHCVVMAQVQSTDYLHVLLEPLVLLLNLLAPSPLDSSKSLATPMKSPSGTYSSCNDNFRNPCGPYLICLLSLLQCVITSIACNSESAVRELFECPRDSILNLKPHSDLDVTSRSSRKGPINKLLEGLLNNAITGLCRIMRNGSLNLEVTISIFT